MKVDPVFGSAVLRICVAMGLTEREARELLGPLVDTAATRFVRGRRGAMLLLGDPGTGKTLAAQRWLVNAYLLPRNWNWDGSAWRYRYAGLRLMRTARQLAQVKQYEPADVERLLAASALVVDDLGQEYLDKAGFLASFVDHLVTERHRRGLDTVLTANLSVQEFRDRYGDRALDRIEHSGGFEVFAGDSLRGGAKGPRTVAGVDWAAVWGRRDELDAAQAESSAAADRLMAGRLARLQQQGAQP